MTALGTRSARIVIAGRPNVGKSTLFNRLLGRRRALVHDEPGVTRDRLEEKAQWWIEARPYEVTLIDTGGLGGERFADEIKRQVHMALEQADVVLALFDGQSGLTPADEEVVRELLRGGLTGLDGRRIPVIGVVNKVDAEMHEGMLSEFFATGLDPLVTVSAEHRRGIDALQELIRDTLGMKPLDTPREDLAGPAVSDPSPSVGDNETELDDEAAEELAAESPAEVELSEEDLSEEDLIPWDEAPEASAAESSAEDDSDDDSYKERRAPRVAIVGKPNAGKSTLINALLGEYRMITSPIAGTTVDAVDSPATLNDKPFVLIDTAGIRRKSRTEQGVEVLSFVQARKALERCDVAILVIDGEEGVTDQDEKIGGIIQEMGCGVILAVNKWDLLAGRKGLTQESAAELVRAKMAYLKYSPLMFISAKRRQGFDGLGDLIDEILSQRKVRIATHELTEWVRRESAAHNPYDAKFYLCHQAGRNPPTFVCHVNNPDKVHFSLRRHLVNAIRERWGYMGSPVRAVFVKGKSRTRGPAIRPKQHGPQKAPKPASSTR